MDETRLRAVVREEIAFAMKTLHLAAGWTEADDDALVAVRRTAEAFEHVYLRECQEADGKQAQEPKNPFTEPDEQPHIHRFEYADDGMSGHSGSFCDCGAEELAVENERRRIAHAAAYLPAVDLNALDAGAYKLLGNLARNDAYTNAVIRLVQHGGPRIGR
jgi:hypothetical protein